MYKVIVSYVSSVYIHPKNRKSSLYTHGEKVTLIIANKSNILRKFRIVNIF